jgi:hypothetical protein
MIFFIPCLKKLSKIETIYLNLKFSVFILSMNHAKIKTYFPPRKANAVQYKVSHSSTCLTLACPFLGGQASFPGHDQ